MLYEELRSRDRIRYAVNRDRTQYSDQSRSRANSEATTVAERFGFDEDEALTLGKAVAGLTAPW
jgi:hypothetical protein